MKKDYFGNNWKSMTFAYGKPKDGDYYAEFRIVYNNNAERDKAANAVRESLCGEKSYINSDVVLNIDEDNVIAIIVAKDGEMPMDIVDEVFDKINPTH